MGFFRGELTFDVVFIWFRDGKRFIMLPKISIKAENGGIIVYCKVTDKNHEVCVVGAGFAEHSVDPYFYNKKYFSVEKSNNKDQEYEVNGMLTYIFFRSLVCLHAYYHIWFIWQATKKCWRFA